MSHQLSKLADVAESIVDGPFGSNLKTSDYVETGVPVLQGKNITNNKFNWSGIRFISEEKADSLSRSEVTLGDHLLIKIGSIGYSAILDDLRGYQRAIIPANLARIRPKNEVVDPQFLHQWLTSTTLTRHLKRVASKTAQPALSLGKIKEAPIPLPPLAEQRRIAAILDKADALRQQRQQAIAKLDELLQSVFLDMFGDPLSGSPFPVVELDEVCNKITDGTHQSPKWTTEGIPFLFQSNVSPGAISFDTKKYISEQTYEELTRRTAIERGDVLYTIVGSYGNAAMVMDDTTFCFQRHIAHLKPNESVVPEYLEAAMNSHAVKHQADIRVTGIAQKTLILRELKKLKIVLPPLDMQQVFLGKVKAMRRAHEHSVGHDGKLTDLFQSLQQRAFNGTL